MRYAANTVTRLPRPLILRHVGPWLVLIIYANLAALAFWWWGHPTGSVVASAVVIVGLWDIALNGSRLPKR